MRRLIALLALIATPMLTAVEVFAADPPPAVKGLWLLTDYPSQTVRPGEVANIRFKLQNAGLAPETLALSVDGVKAAFGELASPEKHTKILVEPWR